MAIGSAITHSVVGICSTIKSRRLKVWYSTSIQDYDWGSILKLYPGITMICCIVYYSLVGHGLNLYIIFLAIFLFWQRCRILRNMKIVHQTKKRISSLTYSTSLFVRRLPPLTKALKMLWINIRESWLRSHKILCSLESNLSNSSQIKIRWAELRLAMISHIKKKWNSKSKENMLWKSRLR